MSSANISKQVIIGVSIGVILGVLGFFGPKLYQYCCKAPQLGLTTTSVRVFRVLPDNLSRCELKKSIQIISDGTKLGLIGTDLRKSAVLLITYPTGETYTLNGVGLIAATIPQTEFSVAANSLSEIDECWVRVKLAKI